jgi:DNA polymerase-1
MAEAREAARHLLDGDRFMAFDTETTGLYVRTPYGDTARTVQVAVRPWDVAYVFETTERWRAPLTHIFSEMNEVVGHNTKFDIHAMTTYGINANHLYAPEAIHDTMWVARLHDERDVMKLKMLAAKYLTKDAREAETGLKRLMTKNGWTWATVPVRYLVEYGGLDAIYTGKLFDLLYPRIGHSLGAYRREQDLQPIVYNMERAGMLIDKDMLVRVADDLHAEIGVALSTIKRLAPGLNPNAPHQIKKHLRDRGHSLPNTQAATLMATDDDFARAILAYRKSQKMASTYAGPWLELITPEGRIHPNLNTMGAKTGRFSGSDPNLQNVKRGHDLRDIFIAAEGHKMVVVDWNQMELRLYAHFARDERMRAAFLKGEDIYQQAADLLGVSRQIGKMVMLASIYGAGPAALKMQCIAQAYKFGLEDLVPELETYDWPALHARFHDSYQIKALADLTELQARRRGEFGEPYITTLGGRRQRPKRITLPAYNDYGNRHVVYQYKDLGNSLVQGSSSDLMKTAIIDADKAGLGPAMRLTVHDELVLEVPDAEVDEATQTLTEIMTRNEFVPPLTVAAQSAQRYGEAK